MGGVTSIYDRPPVAQNDAVLPESNEVTSPDTHSAAVDAIVYSLPEGAVCTDVLKELVHDQDKNCEISDKGADLEIEYENFATVASNTETQISRESFNTAQTQSSNSLVSNIETSVEGEELLVYSEEFDETETDRLIKDPLTRSDLHVFRERLAKLRTARQLAFAEKAREMRELREQLAWERKERKRLETLMLGAEPSEKVNEVVGDESSPQDILKERASFEGPSSSRSNLREEWTRLPEEVDKLRERLMQDREETKTLREVNERLHCELDNSHIVNRSLHAELLKSEHDCSEWQKKYDRLVRDSSWATKDAERLEERIQVLEDEKRNMWEQYDKEKEEINKRTSALKEVIQISKEMLLVREQQVDELRVKLKDIEDSVAERLRAANLKEEYEKQMQHIKELKELYEERNTLLERDHLQLTEKISALEEELSDLNIKYEIAAEEVDTERERVKELNSELAILTVKAKESQKELTLINSLLTQMLVGSGPPGSRALDKLTEQLQQNHDLITQITACELCSDDAVHLPKLLLDLCSQVEEHEGDWPTVQFPSTYDVMTDSTEDPSTISEPSEGLPIVSYKNAKVFTPPPTRTEESEQGHQDEGEGIADRNTIYQEQEIKTNEPILAEADLAVQEIVSNLPKVWRVLSELLSHHAVESPPEETRTCYKSVDTPEGPRNVISVSNTFIRLKELILEKKGLVKEVSRLKHLNSHLETRLDDQEKRLSTVQCELHKTWGVVGRMRAQHQQLHNQEKILRYELQEKRIMVNELKSDLDDCRDLWERARRKNNESETECVKLRSEFAARRLQTMELESGSGESGFSDEDHCDADRSSTPSPIPSERRKENDNNSLTHADLTTLTSEVEGPSGGAGSLLPFEGDFHLQKEHENQGAIKNDPSSEVLASSSTDVQTDRLNNEKLFESASCPTQFVKINDQGTGSGTVAPTTDQRNNSGDELNIEIDVGAEVACSSTEARCNSSQESTEAVTLTETITPEISIPTDTEELEGANGIISNSDISKEFLESLEPANDDLQEDMACAMPKTRAARDFDICTSLESSSNLPVIHEESNKFVNLLEASSTPTLDKILANDDFYSGEPSSEERLDEDNIISDEDRAKAREARQLRLQRLEEQCLLLVRKVDITTHKSKFLSNRLEELHEHYSTSPSMSTDAPSSSEESEEHSGLRSEVLCPPDLSPGENSRPRHSYNPEENSAPLKRVPEEEDLNVTIASTDTEFNPAVTSDTGLRFLQNTETSLSINSNNTDLAEFPESSLEVASNNSANFKTLVKNLPEDLPGCSGVQNLPSSEAPPAVERDTSLATFNERMARREERLKRLEAACSNLHGKVSNTVVRGNEMSERLTEIHEEEARRSEEAANRCRTLEQGDENTPPTAGEK